MIKPLADRIIVKELEKAKEKMSAGGIILTGQDKSSRHIEGVVVAVGRGRIAEPQSIPDSGVGLSMTNWPFYPMEVKVGDEVVFSFGEEYTIRGEKMYILKENDILAIISKE